MSHPEIIKGKATKILRSRAAPIQKIDAGTRELVQKMRRVMHEADGIGLAAPQINIPLAIFVAEVNKKFYALANPEIIKTSQEKDIMEEGCLSLPGLYGRVERPSKITITALDLKGKRVKIKAWGLLARVFQHEIDHLNGVLFIDKTDSVQKTQ